MRLAVLDVATLGADICLSEWKQFGKTIIFETSISNEILPKLQPCDIIVINKSKITEDVLKNLPNLKLICITATGFDNVDIEACRKHKVAVCNVKGYSTNSVAQVTVALALSLANHIPEYSRYVESGEYGKAGVQNCVTPVFNELSGKVWGIIGLGNIGKAVARVAKALGCRVLALKRTPDDEFECTDLDSILNTADIISLHLPLSDETYHLIGETELEKMNSSAILINVARGDIVDESAIVNAIKQNKIGGFATDVFSPEPLSKNSPLQQVLSYPNVLATPHMAWGAYESRMRCINEITKNIKAFLSGEKRNRVDL